MGTAACSKAEDAFSSNTSGEVISTVTSSEENYKDVEIIPSDNDNSSVSSNTSAKVRSDGSLMSGK